MTVIAINYIESVFLNEQQLQSLYEQLGTKKAEDVICRGFERLAVHVHELDDLALDVDITEYERIIHSLIAEAQDIGMTSLADLGVNVLDCRQAGDYVATAATLTRLKRVAEPFLSSDVFADAMLN